MQIGMSLDSSVASPGPTPCVLIADDQPDVRVALELLLKGAGYRTRTADSPAALLESLERDGCDVLLMDLNYARDTTSGNEGLELLPRVRALDRSARVVVMTAWGTIELAVEAMRRGAHDFVLKPWDNAALLRTLRAQEQARRSEQPSFEQAFAARDLSVARRVQSRLLPQAAPRLATLEYAGRCRQAGPVGGDGYDFLALGPGRVGLVLADASGHGVSAALLMSHLQATLRSEAVREAEDLPRLLQAVNAQFFAATAPEHYATLFLGVYDDGTRRLRYVNSGHLPPMLLRSGGACERLAPTAPALGLMEEWSGTAAEVGLTPGDTLLVFSDGASEAPGADGEEFGEARLLAVLRAGVTLAVDVLLASLVAAVQAHAGQHHEDDLTLLAARAR